VRRPLESLRYFTPRSFFMARNLTGVGASV
jgi:hypothetical protein